MTTNQWAYLLAPIIGPVIIWIYSRPGALVARLIWKYMPEGKLRNLLLKKV